MLQKSNSNCISLILICACSAFLCYVGVYLYYSREGITTPSIKELDENATKPFYDSVYKFYLSNKRFPTVAEFREINSVYFSKGNEDRFFYLWVEENAVRFPILIHLTSGGRNHFCVVFHPEREVLIWLPNEDVDLIVQNGNSKGFSDKIQRALPMRKTTARP